MFRRYISRGALALGLAAAALLLMPETSYAQRRGGGSRGGIGGYGGGYRGGYGGYYGGGYRSGYGGYYGGSGLYLGLGLGSYRSGYYGGYGYGAGYPYGYSSYYAPSYNYSAPVYSYSTPGYDYSYAPSTSGYAGTTQSYQSFYPPENATDKKVHVQVDLPDPNAEVWFEGALTQQRGTTRDFESPELMPGRAYTYHIRARWMDNGQMRDETRSIVVQAGQQTGVDFTRPDTSARSNETPRENVPPTATPAVNTGRPAVTPQPNRPIDQQPQSSVPERQPNAAPGTDGEIGPNGRIVNPKSAPPR